MDMQPIRFEGRPALAAEAPPPPRLSPSVFDRGEQIAIVVLWTGLLARALGPYWQTHHLNLLMAPVGELPILLFTLVRRPTEAISPRLGDWLLAAVASFAPLCVVPAAHSPLSSDWRGVATALFLAGLAIQIAAKLSLRRSFGIAPANRGVKVDGLYRFLRHPMYAGYLAMHIGVLGVNFTGWNLAVYAIAWIAQIKRLLAEERLLSADPAYAQYLAGHRWRLIPGLF